MAERAPTHSDLAREWRIRMHQRALLTATSPEDKRRYWMQMADEIMARSPEQVSSMEKKRGLTVVGTSS